VIAKAEGHLAHLIEAESGLIRSLAGISSLTVDAAAAKPAHAAVSVVADAEIYIPLEGLVDFGHERLRVVVELEKAAGELERLTKKLANEGFLAKAALEIVEKDRARAADLAGKVGTLTAQLAELAE
jgi:valyl-tRNA synthetase